MISLRELPGRSYRRLRSIVESGTRTLKDLQWWRSAEGRKHRARLEGLRGLYRGRRCFVMGNGPSLKKVDFSLLRSEITIGSNAVYLIREEMGFQPTFLAVEDRLVAEDRANELNTLSGTTKVFPRDLAYCISADNNTIFVNCLRAYKPFPQFANDFAQKVFWGGTVTFFNLQLAYFLGCSEIYLIGIDHSYKVPPKEQIKNFVITSREDDPNHIHPDYFGKGYRWHDPNLERMERSYRVAREFLDGKGVRVMNATVGGALEVFERVEFARLFA